MKRWRILTAIAGCLAVVTLAVLLWPREHEPEYNGIPLTTFLDRAVGAPNGELTQAITHIGTNALPHLVRAVDYRPSRWRYWLGFKIVRLRPTKLTGRVALWLMIDKAERRADSALVAFGILGSRAAPALADLRRIASKRPSTHINQAILTIMSSISGDFNEPVVNLN